MNRIFSNWNLTRFFSLTIGITVLIQAIMIGQWLGIAFGVYFTSMAVFGFGCAGGSCRK